MKNKRLYNQLLKMLPFLLIVFIIPLFIALVGQNKNEATRIAYAAQQRAKANRYTRPTATPTPTRAPRNFRKPTSTPTIVKLPPQATTVKFGVVVEDYANYNNTIPSLEQKIGTTISTLSIFKQFGHPYNKDLDLGQLSYIKSSGKTLQLAWEPWNPEQGMSQSEDYVKEISTGKYDGYIRQTAQTIKAFGNPVNLRFGHEMNGEWYPWGRRPTDYIAAYSHIHTLFQQEGVTNVRWMWSVNVSENPAELPQYYPGDAMVDVIGIDGFNFGTSQPNNRWETFTSIFGPTYNLVSSRYHKPIIISETASSELGGDKAGWVKNMFEVLPGSFPMVKEVVWFNLLKETDWRIESTPSSINAFRESL